LELTPSEGWVAHTSDLKEEKTDNFYNPDFFSDSIPTKKEGVK
jgi:hypothetical protein